MQMRFILYFEDGDRGAASGGFDYSSMRSSVASAESKRAQFEQFSLADDYSRPRSEALALHLNLCLETKIASFAVGPFRAFQPRV